MVEFEVRSYGSLGSTSDEAFRLAHEGAPHGTVVTAREQMAGRGRTGRGWQSPPGNLYLSVLLRLGLPPARVAELSFVAALAVADTVDTFLPGRATLKWPNDVLVDGAKVAGILIEQAAGVTVLGVGINVAHHPSGLGYPTTALLPIILAPGASIHAGGEEEGRGCSAFAEQDGGSLVASVRDSLLLALACRLASWCADGFDEVRADWLARAHPISTPLRAGTTQGAFAGIDPDGALLLDTVDGRVRIVGGEVQAR